MDRQPAFPADGGPGGLFALGPTQVADQARDDIHAEPGLQQRGDYVDGPCVARLRAADEVLMHAEHVQRRLVLQGRTLCCHFHARSKHRDYTGIGPRG